MPKATKAQRIALHDKQMMVFAMADKVFSVTPRSDVPFMECLKAAPAELRDKHTAAIADLAHYEQELIAAGRAWRDQFGGIQLN